MTTAWWEHAYPGGPMVAVRGECVIEGKIAPNGYARAYIDGIRVWMHRYAWEQEHGEIPAGSHIHHECGNKACSNVEHLRCLTGREHVQLLRHCSHPESDRYIDKRGKSYCRVCVRPYQREYKRRKRAERRRA